MSQAPLAGRRERRRVENRDRLLQAARHVMAREGYERASIAAIAADADLGFGTFYSHFASKQAIFQSLVEAAAAARYALVEAAVAPLDDPAERLAVGAAVLVGAAAREAELTRFLLEARRHVDNPGDEALLAPLRAGVAAGCAAGRFRVADQAAAVAAVAGCVRGLVSAVATRRLAARAATRAAAELPLRLLGLASDEAAAIAERAEKCAGLQPRGLRAQA